jgi:hypothetical protein
VTRHQPPNFSGKLAARLVAHPIAANVADDGFCAQARIVCAGKWTRTLLEPLGMALPVPRMRETFAWFGPRVGL